MSYTPEEQEKIDAVRDLMRGGPRKRLQQFASNIGVDYEELLERCRSFVASYGSNYWSDGGRFEGTSIYDEFWRDFELVTGEVVPSDLQYNFFSCSC